VCGYDGVPCTCTNCDSGPLPQCAGADTWHCDAPNPTTGCPAGAPNLGTACSQAGLVCKYECGPNGARECSGGVWVARYSPCPISVRRAKRDIEYLKDEDLARIAAELTKIRLATYEYVDPALRGRRRLGFILDDNLQSPASDAEHNQVDLYAYTSMAVATLQLQAKEIASLRREVARLTTEVAKSKDCPR
jgi:hypothetical protein